MLTRCDILLLYYHCHYSLLWDWENILFVYVHSVISLKFVFNLISVNDYCFRLF